MRMRGRRRMSGEFFREEIFPIRSAEDKLFVSGKHRHAGEIHSVYGVVEACENVDRGIGKEFIESFDKGTLGEGINRGCGRGELVFQE